MNISNKHSSTINKFFFIFLFKLKIILSVIFARITKKTFQNKTFD